MHDQAIVELYWARDQSAIRQSDEKYGPYCRTIAHNVLHDPLDSEECVNDTWHRAWESMPPQRPNLLRAFFGTITRNLARMRLREQGRTITVSPEDWHTMFADSPAVDPHDRMVLSSLLEVLSEEERQIILLHAMTGLKHREIAELLDLKLATVLSKYNRAIKKLRHAWKENL